MPDTTFEEAKRCPSCQEPGKQVARQPIGMGGNVYTFSCENERCPNKDERWLVQVNPNGTIPQAGHRGPKAFERPRESTVVMQQARDELAIIDWLSTHPGKTAQDAIRALGG